MGRSMGLGMIGEDIKWKRKNRWLLFIPGVCGEASASILPPQKAARPNVSFKEMQVEHLTETLSYPSKPEYKPVQITIYDYQVSNNPVFAWLSKCYRVDRSEATWQLAASGLIQDISLELYDGGGNLMERWVYENAWPQAIDFGDLDMGVSDVITCDVTLRYARAYIQQQGC